ncbi:hypothetical protein M378DRAFT_55595, partial [Amanita muscaria Koide BX008]
DGVDWSDKELETLAGDIDAEERAEVVTNERNIAPIDNEDGLVDERARMSAREVRELEKGVMPARRVLTKLRKVAFAIKNSSTKLLPRWRTICKELGLVVRMMPRDVKTRWNSTFDMLEFAIEYRLALDKIT